MALKSGRGQLHSGGCGGGCSQQGAQDPQDIGLEVGAKAYSKPDGSRCPSSKAAVARSSKDACVTWLVLPEASLLDVCVIE